MARDPDRPRYREVLRYVHEELRPRTYIEIGLHRGQSLSLARPGTRALGIDPQPELDYELPEDAQAFFLPSDTFFEVYDLEEVLGGRVDLAFVDGMHLFEYALRDFINIERHCTPDSLVFVHDCYPMSSEAAERLRQSKLWTGDVWKLIPSLKRYRPDLTVAVADVPRGGLGIIRGLDPDSTVLSDRRREIMREFVPLGTDYLDADKAAKLNLVPGNWETIRSLLPSVPWA
jgi:hypothetical protein